MSRTPDRPASNYTRVDAERAIASIRAIRREARDPDLDALPRTVVDELDVDAAMTYIERHRQITPAARAAELPHRALLVEYLRQRNAAAHERRLLSLLQAGHQLAARPISYGEPMGLNTRQAVYDRRVRLARKLASAADQRVDEGHARAWLHEHGGEIQELAGVLVDARDDLAELVNGVARAEVLRSIDEVGTLMNSRRASQDLCTAVALAVHRLRPGTAAEAVDPALREHIHRGLRLLW